MSATAWGILGAVVFAGTAGALLEGLITHVLEKRGLYERIARHLVLPPYYHDPTCVQEAVRNCPSAFYLITGNGTLLARDHGQRMFDDLESKRKGCAVEILFMGDPELPDVRGRAALLFKRGFTVRVIDLKETSAYKAMAMNSLRALFSANSSQDVYIRTEILDKKGQPLYRRFRERDLGKLVQAYFHITPKVVNVEYTGDTCSRLILERVQTGSDEV